MEGGIKLDSVMLGSKIRSLRIKEGMTLEQLATSLNIKRNMLSNYELGKSVISAELLTKIADFFGISLDYLTQRQNPVLAESKSGDGMVNIPVFLHLHSNRLSDDKNLSQIIYSISIPEIMLLDGNFFGLAATDDSLDLKSCPKGSVLIVKEQTVAKSGEIIVYSYKENDVHYGIYKITGNNIIVSPSSSDESFSPVVYKVSDKDFHIIGKVIMVLGHIKN